MFLKRKVSNNHLPNQSVLVGGKVQALKANTLVRLGGQFMGEVRQTKPPFKGRHVGRAVVERIFSIRIMVLYG
jgi:hypothetical protein